METSSLLLKLGRCQSWTVQGVQSASLLAFSSVVACDLHLLMGQEFMPSIERIQHIMLFVFALVTSSVS